MPIDVSEHESTLAPARAEHLANLCHVEELPITSILDVGCRAGTAISKLRDIYGDAVRIDGVDLLPDALELAGEVADNVYQLDAADMNLILPATYDWVFCSHTLEHCVDIARVVDELIRVSRVGVYIVVPLESDAKFASYSTKTSPDGELGMHKFHTMDPLVWLNFFHNRGLVLMECMLSPRHSDLCAVFVHEGVVAYGGKVYS